MVIDSSAMVAIAFGEAFAPTLLSTINEAPACFFSASSYLETGLVISRGGLDGGLWITEFLPKFNIEVVPFTEKHALIALEAHRRFGKGKHPAGLNFGDCMAYALAQATNQPLLYIGADFSKTDITSALPTG